MSVKCTTCDKSCSFRKGPFSTDYAALLARHNALVEAVAKMFAAHEAWTQKGGASYPDWADGRARYDAASAEVDRLIANETAADCKEDG